MKAKSAEEARTFTDIPNVGPRIAHDFMVLGFKTPSDLKNQDPLLMYKKLCIVTKQRHDPCVLDTFMAVTDFMNGGEAKLWFAYTAKRKSLYSKDI